MANEVLDQMSLPVAAVVSDETVYDVLVVGGGTTGIAAAYYAARQGSKVAVIEQFHFINDQNSSTGDSRFFRTMYSDETLCKLAMAAHPMWEEVQKEWLASGGKKDFFVHTDVVFYGVPGGPETPEGAILKTQAVLDKLDVGSEVGFAAALVHSFEIEISDGWLDIDLADKKVRTFLSGLQIERLN